MYGYAGQFIFVEWNSSPMDVWTIQFIFVEWNTFPMDVKTGKFVLWDGIHCQWICKQASLFLWH